MGVSAEKFRETYVLELRTLGYSEDFIRDSAGRLAPFFDELEKNDAERLFYEEDRKKAFFELSRRFAPSQTPDITQMKLRAIDFMLRAARTVPPEKKCRPEDGPELRPSMPEIPDIEETLAGIRSDARFQELEKRRKELFDMSVETTPELVSEQMRFISKEYGLRPVRESAAKLYAGSVIKRLLAEGIGSAVEFLADLSGIKSPEQAFFTAARYCACCMPEYYPVCSKYTDAALKYFRERDAFFPFTPENLRYYDTYKKILNIFRQKYSLEKYSLADIALYLEFEGKKLYNK